MNGVFEAARTKARYGLSCVTAKWSNYAGLALLVSSTTLTYGGSFSGLPENAPSDAKKWAVGFDFDGDSCYPAPAMSNNGAMNAGLNNSGDKTGECREMDQFRNANTYYRSASIKKNGVEYAVHMYALYFEKDQAVSYLGFGHRHDWEFVLVWTTNGKLTHASFSAHGGVDTRARQELDFDAGRENAVKAVYHKDGIRTHSFRPAKKNEVAENALRSWHTPTLVDWRRLTANQQRKFNEHNFGDANCSFNDRNFFKEIGKNPPSGYPRAAEWLEERPRSLLVASVRVNNGPLPGQSWRASKNFALDYQGYTRLRWVVEGVGSNPNLSFDVGWDVSGGKDKTLIRNLKSGTITGNWRGDQRLYIGGVRGAGAPFVVKVYAEG